MRPDESSSNTSISRGEPFTGTNTYCCADTQTTKTSQTRTEANRNIDCYLYLRKSRGRKKSVIVTGLIGDLSVQSLPEPNACLVPYVTHLARVQSKMSGDFIQGKTGEIMHLNYLSK